MRIYISIYLYLSIYIYVYTWRGSESTRFWRAEGLDPLPFPPEHPDTGEPIDRSRAQRLRTCAGRSADESAKA